VCLNAIAFSKQGIYSLRHYPANDAAAGRNCGELGALPWGKAKDTYSYICRTQNRRYWASEFGAIGLSYVAAGGSSYGLYASGVDNATNAAITLGIKSVSFIAIHLAAYYKTTKDSPDAVPLRKHIIKLSKTNFLGLGITLGLKSIGAVFHYYALESGISPALAPMAAYPIPGAVSALVRHGINWYSGLFSFRRKNHS